MNSPMMLRSPNLAGGGPVHVVRLFEHGAQRFARGALVRSRPAREVHLHVTPGELQHLQKTWGAPQTNRETGVPEYGFAPRALNAAKRFASGGTVAVDPVTLGRTRNPTDIPDYFTYGEGPEHQFFLDNQVPTVSPSQLVHTPATPVGPSTQSAGRGIGLGDIGTLGTLAQYGAKGANMLGYDNAFTQGLSKAGDVMQNPVKAGLDYLKGGTGTAAGTGTLASTGALSGASALGAAAPAAIDIGTADLGSMTAGQLFGTSASEAAGAGAGSLGAAGGTGALGAGTGAAAAPASTGALGSLGSSLAASGATTALPLAAAAFAAAELINKSFTGHGDEKRNDAYFKAAFPGVKNVQPGRAAGVVLLPDGRLLSNKDYQALSGAYYGATVAPDAEKDKWQKQFDELNSSLKSISMKNPDAFASQFMRGYHWDAATGRFVSDGHAQGGSIYGGALSKAGRYVRGPGTGRSDSIDAKLSDGEYVLTAEDVALLGDGSSEAGAKRLDQFRTNLRRHKGGALAKGKISPNAKSPLAYLNGAR